MDTSELIFLEKDRERSILRDGNKLVLCGEICEEEARCFLQDVHCVLTRTEKPEQVELIISSSGGAMDAGLSIIDGIRELQRNGITVIGRVHGQAMSMACFILQACDKRLLSPYTWLMVHGITETGFIFDRDLKNSEIAHQWLKDVTEAALVELLVTRNTGDTKYKKREYWRKLLHERTPQFFDAKKAVEVGLADGVEC